LECTEETAAAFWVNREALTPVRPVLPEKLKHAVEKVRDGAGVADMIAVLARSNETPGFDT